MTKWKALIGVLLIFMMGMLLGAVGSFYMGKKQLEHALRGPQEFSFFLAGRMTRILHLDQEQEQKLIEVVKKARRKMKFVREEMEPRVRAIFEESEIEINHFLRDDQKEKFKKMIRKRKHFFREFDRKPPHPEARENFKLPEGEARPKDNKRQAALDGD